MALSRRSRRPSIYVFGVLFSVFASCAIAQPAKEQWHADLAQGYQALADSSEKLQQQSQSYCQAPDGQGLHSVSDAWRDAFLTWQQVRFVDFGPIERDNIAWQLQFWPDSKNLVARKTDNWLQPGKPIDAAALASDSVAVKGFPALEYLLFDDAVIDGEHALPQQRTCDLLQAISKQIHDNTVQLRNDWTRFESHFLSRPEYAHTTVSAVMHTLEIMRDKRLAAPMGLAGKTRRNPYIADAWRSGESLATVEATLKGLQQYFLPGFINLMAERKLSPFAEQFEIRLAETLVRLDAMPDALGPLLKTDAGYRDLQLLYIDIDRMATLLNGSIASELGIIKGFNASDGD